MRDRDQQRHAHFAAAQTRDSESSLQPRSRLGRSIEFLLELSSGARDDRPSLAARQLSAGASEAAALPGRYPEYPTWGEITGIHVYLRYRLLAL